jgi:hypothetical protein
VSLFLLLFGTLCGDFALLHDAALRALGKLWLGEPPGMLCQAFYGKCSV